jgi:NAD(P)H-flavin reductase
VGLVTALIPTARFDPERAVAMVVGPELMMRFTVAALRERGVPEDRIWVSLERSMKCGTAHCGHCMLGPNFICKDGPVFRHDVVAGWLSVRRM